MSNDRLGLILIAAALCAITLVGGLAYRYQASQSKESVRVRGMATARAIAGMESGADRLASVRGIAGIQENEDFAYLAAVSPAGEKRYEVVSAGSIVPAAVMPTQPFAWFGEHVVDSPGDGRRIREFYAPIMQNGQLGGFVRAGYYAHERGVFGTQLSTLGLLALPIFALTTFAYLLIRREIKPLRRLGEKMRLTAASYGTDSSAPVGTQDYRDFIQRFDSFIQLVQSRVALLNAESVASQADSRLQSYKHEKAEAALNSLPDAVLVLDDTGLATFVTQKLELLLGRSREEILGQPPQRWCEHKQVLAFLVRHGQSTSSIRSSTLEFVPNESDHRRFSISAFPLFSPRDRNIAFGMLFAFRDITGDSLARQAGADFVAHIAHELKTPLHSIMGYSELLLDHATLSEAEQVNAVNVIRAEVERAGTLINNLLNISKLETDTLRPERTRVRLHELMQDAFDSLLNSSLGKEVTLELAVPPDLGSVRIDKDLFRIAVDNLLSNAIKYSNPGGKVIVSAGVRDDGQIELKVRDQGIGISADDCGKVFAKYYRAANSAVAGRSGHGLGLYLAKQIIELHHGTLSVSSELGKGTEFVITLKAQSAQPELSEVA